MGKHLILAGAGHAHLTILTHISEFIAAGCRVTVINDSPYHYYSGMGPGALGGIYKPEEIRFNVKKLSESHGARFISGIITSIQPEENKITLNDLSSLNYDIISFNTGSEIDPGNLSPNEENIFTVKPIANLITARSRILEALKQGPVNVAVAGGGAAGCEIAGNLRNLQCQNKNSAPLNIRLLTRGLILSHFAPNVRRKTLRHFYKNRITCDEHRSIQDYRQKILTLDNQSEWPCDFLFIATGVRPHTLFAPISPGEIHPNGLAVNAFLQSPQHPNIFGGGDCIRFLPRPLAKAGVHAVRQNPILLHNLRAALCNQPLIPYLPQKSFLLILNLGAGKALFIRNSISCYGWLALKIKDHIDRKFMDMFQLCDETKESPELPPSG